MALCRQLKTTAGRHVLPFLNKLAGYFALHRYTCGSLHRLYAWARQRGQVAIDPTGDIQTSTPARREHTLTLAELAGVWHAAEAIGGPHGDVIKLMITTGQRESEVAGMLWGESARWTMPPERTKAKRQHVLPLPGLAVELLITRLGERPPARDDLVLPTTSRDGRTLVAAGGIG